MYCTVQKIIDMKMIFFASVFIVQGFLVNAQDSSAHKFGDTFFYAIFMGLVSAILIFTIILILLITKIMAKFLLLNYELSL